MKKPLNHRYRTGILILALMVLSTGAYAGIHNDGGFSITPFNSNICRLYNIDIKTDNGSIFLTEHNDDIYTVEITEDYDLYIDGKKVKTNAHQKELLKECYILTFEISTEAKAIGHEGLRIGIKGLKLGVKAVAGVFRLLSPSYDADDLERDMEFEASKLEKEAENIEKWAENLEKKADDLEAIAEELYNETPELQALDWF